MADLSRDEVLFNFQACTGIEDVGACIMWLEQAGWDLLTAIRNALPKETQTLPSDAGNAEVNSEYEIDEPLRRPHIFPLHNGGMPVTLSNDFMDDPSTSYTGKMFEFLVHFNDRRIRMMLPETANIHVIKMKLLVETSVPVCSQVLTGWEVEQLVLIMQNPDIQFKYLNLKPLTVLELTIQVENPEFTLNRPMRPSDVEYTFNVFDETKCKDMIFKFHGDHTVGDVKNEVALMTNILYRHQEWCGWPPNINDNTKLVNAGLNLPTHTLSLRHVSRERRTAHRVESDSSNSVEEFEDATENFTVSEEMFVDDLTPRRIEPLIPPNVEEEVTGAIFFSDGFSRRYGDSRPDFFQGSLEDAIKEACLRPVKERKLLALYLHHDKSVLSNVFCTELLCFESVLQTLSAYFTIWGWDITNDANKNMFLANVTRYLGAQVADTISGISVDSLPALIIITRSRSNTELFNVINGNTSVSELLTMLIHAVDVYSEIQKAEMVEEDERNKRELIKIEQDQAYQQSLLLDRAKAEAKKQQELQEKMEKDKLEKEKKALEEQRQAERLFVQALVPDEPEEGKGTIKLKFRCPKGDILSRRFLSSHMLKDVFNYLVVEGYRIEEYKVILSWPRRDLTTLSLDMPLADIKLHIQETLILEER